jgi:hypothetical protein
MSTYYRFVGIEEKLCFLKCVDGKSQSNAFVEYYTNHQLRKKEGKP